MPHPILQMEILWLGPCGPSPGAPCEAKGRHYSLGNKALESPPEDRLTLARPGTQRDPDLETELGV